MTSPTTGPRPFLTAQWRELLMLNFVVDPALLAPLVPRGTELDRWQGEAYASLVGFRFLRTKLLGVPVPWHRDFDELNLRFYVSHRGPEGVRRGVAFVRELVPRRAIAWTARACYNEPYLAVPMRHEVGAPGGSAPRPVRYSWRIGGAWHAICASTRGEPTLLRDGSEEEFIAEHYWGYTAQRDGGTIEYRVEHPRWRVWRAEAPRVEGDLAATYGREFARALAGAPRSAFVAEGSPVTVYRPRRCA
jgi:uncharacterized protein YqjF (DUF2071 family)